MSQINRDMTEISRCAAQFRNEKLAPMGLKSCHASYLVHICKTPGISQDKLAKTLCINKSNVARQVVVLEEQGYITRVPCNEDKRVMMLYPTEKAQTLLPQLYEIFDQWDALVTQDLAPEELQQLSFLLEKMKYRATQWMEAE